MDRWMSVEEAAVLMGHTRESLIGEIAQGTLKAHLKLDDLMDWRSGSQSSIERTKQMTFSKWVSIPGFGHMWPDASVENFVQAFHSSIVVHGKQREVVIGFTERESAGMKNRARAVVFYQLPPKERPLVEFSGDSDLVATEKYASPIKLRGGNTQLKRKQPIPAEYGDLPRDIFSQIVSGPYASSAVAVVADASDHDRMLDIMATHGVIRGIYKGWL